MYLRAKRAQVLAGKKIGNCEPQKPIITSHIYIGIK